MLISNHFLRRKTEFALIYTIVRIVVAETEGVLYCFVLSFLKFLPKSSLLFQIILFYFVNLLSSVIVELVLVFYNFLEILLLFLI